MMAPTVPSKGVLTGSKSLGKRQPTVALSKPPISQAARYILPISARSVSSAQFRPSIFQQVLTTSVVTLSLLSPHLQAAPVSTTTGKSLNRYSVFRVAQNKLLPSLYITVDKTPGVGDFNCVKGALDSLPRINLVRVVIKVNPGVYTEKIEITSTKASITMEGGGANNTVIQWGDTADTKNPRGFPIGTKFSATFAFDSPYFIAKKITFKNTTLIPPPRAVGKQVVALRVSGDTAAFWGCRVLGAQDTLYDDQGRHYFKECYIEGSVDFTFGNALSMYEGCHVHAITSGDGAVTAQKRGSLLEDTGFSFVKCKVTGSGALYLGRAWGTFSRVVFAYTNMDNIIVPKGWYRWGDPSRTVFYGKYKCTGPRASFSGRLSWSRELTNEGAKPFIDLSHIDGDEWISL